MSTQYQLRRGTTAEVLLFTGAQGEVVVNTDTHAVVVQDGVTAGGYPMATSPQVTSGTFYYNEAAGSAADAYILVPKANTNTPSIYPDGGQFGFITTHPNTGPATANFQGLGVKSLKYPGGVDPLGGEISGRVYLIYDAANDWLEIQRKATGPTPQLRTVGASVASSALTVSLAPCLIDFRATSLGSGTINTRTVTSQISMVVPNGATLGTANGVLSRIILLAIYGPVNAEMAVINLPAGVMLDESTLISTTAVSVASSSVNVAYSTTARTNVPFRIVGFIDSTQATAGAWNTSPSTIQGAGGQALLPPSGIGYVQTWQDVTASRALATTYTNTTGKPILALVSCTSGAVNGFAQLNINGVLIHNTSQAAANGAFVSTGILLVPPGATYSAVNGGGSTTLSRWMELRT